MLFRIFKKTKNTTQSNIQCCRQQFHHVFVVFYAPFGLHEACFSASVLVRGKVVHIQANFFMFDPND